MRNILTVIILCLFLTPFANGQIKKYCYDTSSGSYVMSLFDDGTGKVLYQLYNSSGGLVKTMQGEWSMRNEGVYGPAYVITISWTGTNAGMQDLKYTAQYDGNGSLQGIIDSQSRIWNYCR